MFPDVWMIEDGEGFLMEEGVYFQLDAEGAKAMIWMPIDAEGQALPKAVDKGGWAIAEAAEMVVVSLSLA